MKNEITTKQAVDKLTSELRADKDFYFAYQSNIAMSFYDAMKPRLEKGDFNSADLQMVANEGAVKFMEMWINQ